MSTYSRRFFRSRLGRAAKLSIVAMLALNVVALHDRVHPDHGAAATRAAEAT